MMDFKLILLLVGLGLLLMVILYALWGFLGGLKRELKCTAVLLVLLLFGWLIFSDPALMMDTVIPASVTSMLSSLGVTEGSATVWEMVLQILRTQVPNGATLFIEGREAYELAYDLVAGVMRGVGLIAVTIVMIFLAGFIRLVSHIVKLIIAGVKKKKAKEANTQGELVEESNGHAKQEDESVLVLKGIEGADDVTVTTGKNELPAPKKVTQRIWGAVVGAVKACVVICILFVPLSGVVSIASEISPETRELANEAINSEIQFTASENGSTNSTAIDVVFDFVEAYQKSAVGTVVESSSYFFGDSFSTLMFDGLFSFTTDNQKIYLREELVTLVQAVNALEGNIDYKNLDQAKLEKALDILKDSKLLPELVPAGIEYAYEIEAIKTALVKANQEALFLQLRYVDWDHDLEKLLDVIKVVYTFDIFGEDFNYLTLDTQKVRQIVKILNTTEFLPRVLTLGVHTAMKLDAVQDLVKDPEFRPVLTEVNWSNDLLKLVDVYESFQKIGITSLDGISADFILEVAFEENHPEILKEILNSLTDMTLFTTVLTPTGEKILNGVLESNGYGDLVGILPITTMTAEQWKADLNVLVDLAVKVNELNVLTFDLNKMDITSEQAISTIKEAIDQLLGTQTSSGLNLLNSEVLNELVEWALIKFDVVSADANIAEILKDVTWAKEGEILKQLVDVYDKLNKYEEFDIQTSTYNFLELLDKEGVGELIVEALEALVESDLAMGLLPDVIDHKLTPLADGYEAADILQDILANVSSEEIANEIKLLVEAVFSAKDLGLLQVPSKGVSAIDFSKTDDIKNLINTLCDSKLIDGYEARILRVVFKVLKFEVDLELLEVDYDNEQALLNAFIDEIAPVLQDPEFKLFDENNKIVIDKEFLTRQDISETLINSVQILFGDYETGTEGSKLATNLLSDLYLQIVKDRLPDEPVYIKEILDIVDVESMTNEELAQDISIVAFSAEELIALGVQNLINKQPIDLSSGMVGVHVEKIFNALEQLNIAKKHGSELLAWGVNFGVDQINSSTSFNLDLTVTDADFKDVDWTNEISVLSRTVKKVEELIRANSINDTDELINFFKNKSYQDVAYITDDNLTMLVNTYQELSQSSVLAVVLHAGMNKVVDLAKDAGLDLSYLTTMTVEELSEDLINLSPILRKVVHLGVAEFVAQKDLSTIDYSTIASILYDSLRHDDLLSLNVVNKHPDILFSELINFAVSKAVPNIDFTLTASELAEINWENDFKTLSEIVLKLQPIITGDLGLASYSDIVNFFTKEIANNQTEVLNKVLTDSVILQVQGILQSLSHLELMEVVSPKALDIAITEYVVPKEAGLEFIVGSVSGEELVADLEVIANTLPHLVDLGLVKILKGSTDTDLNKDIVTEIVSNILSLNVVNNNNAKITNYAVDKVANLLTSNVAALKGLNIDYDKSVLDEFTEETWTNDQELLTNIIGVLADYVYNDLGIRNKETFDEFIRVGEFKNTTFYTKEVIDLASNVLKEFFLMETIDLLLPSFIDFGLQYVEKLQINGQELGLDLSYIVEGYRNGDLTNEMLADDVVTILEMADAALYTNIVDLVVDIIQKDYDNTPIELDKYASIIARLGELNVLNFASDKTANVIINLVITLTKQDFQTSDNVFADMTEENWLEDSAHLGDLLVKAQEILDELSLKTITDVINFVKEKRYDTELATLATDEHVDLVVEFVQMVLEFNAGNVLVTEVANYALNKFEDKLDLTFLVDQVTNAKLHSDLETLGLMLKEAIAFGVIELVKEKELSDIDLSHVARVVELLPELSLYVDSRPQWLMFAAEQVSTRTSLNVEFTLHELNELDYSADNAKLREVIMLVDELLEVNEHDTLTEVTNFFKNNGFVTEQWATEENARRVLNIVDGLSDIKLLPIVAGELMEEGLDFLISKNIDVEFFKDQSTLYTPEMIAEDLKTIVYMANQALDFGALQLIWEKQLDPIDVSYLSNVISSIEELHLFTLSRAEWVVLIAEQVSKAVNIPVDVTVDDFADVNWANENQLVCELINQIGVIIDNNNLNSLEVIRQFVQDKAYLSVQFISEENANDLTKVLDIISELEAVAQFLPNLVQYGVEKIPNLDLGVDYAEMSPELISSDLKVISEMLKNAISFGAVEIYENILWRSKYVLERDIELSYVKEIVSSLEEINIFTVARPQWIAYLVNNLGKSANLSVELEDLEMIDFALENQNLVNIIDQVETLLNNVHMNNLRDMYSWYEQKGYISAQYINDQNILAVADILESIANLQLLLPVADQIFDLAIAKTDFNFLVGYVTNEEIVSDLNSLVNAVRDVVAFGAVELYYYQTLEYVDLTYVHDALQKVLDLNIVKARHAQLTSLLVNLLGRTINVDFNVTSEDFAVHNWTADAEVILEIVNGLDKLLQDSNITSTNLMKRFINEKLYLKAQFVNETTIKDVLDILTSVTNIKLLNVIVDELAVFGLEKVNSSQVDLSFLIEGIKSGDIQAKTIISDLSTIIAIANEYVEFGLYDMIYNNDYVNVDTEEFIDIFVKLDKISMLNKYRADWSILVVNSALSSVGITLSHSDLAEISTYMWETEIDTLGNTLVAIYEYAKEIGYANGSKVYELYTDFRDNKVNANYLVDKLVKDEDGNVNHDAVDKLQAVVDTLVESHVVTVLLDKGLDLGIDKLKEKDYDFSALSGKFTNQELQSDVHLLAAAMNDLVKSGILDVVLNKGTIPYQDDETQLLYSGIEKVLSLNLLNKDSDYIVNVLVKDIDAFNDSGLQLKDKADDLIAIIDNVTYLLRSQKITTVQEIIDVAKKETEFKLIFNDQITLIADAFNEILSIVGNDEFYSQVILSTAEGYAQDFLNGYAGLADIYHFYNASTLASDVLGLAEVFNQFTYIDLYYIYQNRDKIPYERDDIVETIVTTILGLNYFNEPGRVTAIVQGLETITGADLSTYHQMNIDFAGDAQKIIEAYKDLQAISQYPDYPYEYLKDFSEKGVSYLLTQGSVSHIKDALLELKATTIYTETDGVLFVLVLPILKVVAPEYYEALNLSDQLINDQLIEDASDIIAIINTITDSSITEALSNHNSPLKDKNSVVNDVQTVLEHLINLHMLENGSLTKIVNLLLRDFVNGKTINGKVLPSDFTADNIDWNNDVNRIVSIVADFMDVLVEENSLTINEIKELVQKDHLVELMMNTSNLMSLTSILETVSKLTMLDDNIGSVYKAFALPWIEKNQYDKFVSYESATNQQLIEDISNVSQIIQLIAEMGVADIYHGGTINYDQADRVDQVLSIFANSNYVKLHSEELVNLMKDKLTSFKDFDVTVNEVNVKENILALSAVYRAAVPFLTNPEYMYTTYADYKHIADQKQLTSAELSELLGYVFANLDLVSAIFNEVIKVPVAEYLTIDAFKAIPESDYSTVINHFNPSDLTLAEIEHDLELVAKMLENLANSGIKLAYTLNEGQYVLGILSGSQFDEVSLVNLVDNIFDLKVIENEYSEIITALFGVLKIETTNIDLSNVNYAAEEEVIKELIHVVMTIKDQMGFVTLQDMIDDYRHMLNLEVKDNSFINKLATYWYQNMKDKVTFEVIPEMMLALSNSSLLDQIAVPLYNKYLASSMPAELGSFDQYTPELINEDMLSLLKIAILINDSKVYERLYNSYKLESSIITPMKNVVKELLSLNIIKLKANDIVKAVDAKVEHDLSKIDLSNIDWDVTAEQFANLVRNVYNIYDLTNEFNLDVKLLGVTPLWRIISETYDELLKIELVQEVAPWAVQTFTPYGALTKTQILSILNDFSNALPKLIELGFLSNDGVNMSDAEGLYQLVDALFNTLTLDNTSRAYVDFIIARASTYGVLPLDYSKLDNTTEIEAFKNLKEIVTEFMDAYRDALTNKNWNVLLSADCQNYVNEILTTAYTSDLLASIIPQFTGGTIRVFANDVTYFNEFDHMSEADFHELINDVFVLAGYLRDLGVLDNNIQYSNVDTIKDILNFIVSNRFTTNNCGYFAKLLIGTIGGNSSNLDLRAIDYVSEKNILISVLDALKPALELPGVDLNDLNTIKSKEFMLIATDALQQLTQSVLFRQYARDMEMQLLAKVDYSNDAIVALKDSLIDFSNYTKEEIVADWTTLMNIVKCLAELEFFENSGTGFNLDNATQLNSLVQLVLDLKAFEGKEDIAINTILSFIDFIEVDVDYTNINWEKEKPLFMNFVSSVTQLITNDQFDIDNVTEEIMKNREIQALIVSLAESAALSDIGAQIFPDVYDKRMKPYLSSDYQDFIDFSDPNFERTMWKDEFTLLFECYNDLEEMNYNSGNFDPTIMQTVNIIEKLYGINGNQGLYGVKKSPKTWANKIFKDGLVPTIGYFTGFDFDKLSSDAEVIEEIGKITAALTMINTHFTPNAKLSEIDFSKIYSSDDNANLTSLFNSLVDSQVLYDMFVAMIDQTIKQNTSENSDFNISELVSQAFKDLINDSGQYYTYAPDVFTIDNGVFNEYTSMQTLVDILRSLNQITVNGTNKEGLGLDTIALRNNTDPGKTFPIAGETDGNGLREILLLMLNSKVFDISAVAGSDGIIVNWLVDNNVIYQRYAIKNFDFTSGYLVVADEIDNIIDVVQEIRAIKATNVNFEEVFINQNKDRQGMILNKLNKSKVLREISAEISANAIVEAVNKSISGISEAQIIEQFNNSSDPIIISLGNILFNHTTMPNESDWENDYISMILSVIDDPFAVLQFSLI